LRAAVRSHPVDGAGGAIELRLPYRAPLDFDGLVRRSPGRRVPGHVDAHELALRAVLGQQVSIGAAVTLAGRLVAAHGDALVRPLGTVTHLFPTAAAVASADPGRLAMPAPRANALLTLAAALADVRTFPPGFAAISR
jgi:3-methyladenine DNA glycosylase/8-oxoguanine DNA glycosylase